MLEPRSAPPVHVVIADDHPMLREGTRALLERQAGIVVVGATGEGAAALRLVANLRPDVLLLDVHLPDLSGVEVARRLRADHPAVAVLVLTNYEEAGYIRAMLQLGVRGYLGKTASGDQIVAAVRAVARGRGPVLSEGARAALGGGDVALTAREQEVLHLLAAGRRNGEIAAALSVSVNTVEFHVRHLLQKFGARSRTEVVLKARQQGYAPPELRAAGDA